MIRTAILAFALVALPSAALAQSQVVLPDIRMLRLPAAAADDGPPANYINIAPEYNGWIYQEIAGSPAGPTQPGTTRLYWGEGYPATIMVCPAQTTVNLLLPGGVEVLVGNNKCGTVTTDQLRISTGATVPIKIRYRILAVHRAAD